MTEDKFLELLTNEVSSYKTFLETANNQWIVKGFVDVDRNVSILYLTTQKSYQRL